MKCEDCKWCKNNVCYRYPPKVVTVTSDHLHVLIASAGERPAVYKDDFCGEFEEKKQ